MGKTISIYELMNNAEVIEGVNPNDISEEILSANKPIILKGLVSDWPMVQKSQSSTRAAMDYLAEFDSGMTIGAGFLPSHFAGRLFYNDDLSGFNFDRVNTTLADFFTHFIGNIESANPNGMYVGSTHVDKLLPGFRKNNDLASLSDKKPLVSIWLSNRTRISAHHDVPSNIACCVSGKRRFTLFPPEQIENLYIGPLDNTPAGQAISLVDFNEPDFDKFPKFKQAIETGIVAELSPGDALFLPSMWWHHVEGLGEFNVLVNYWWQNNPAYMGAPMDALFHALLNIKNLPEAERIAWKAMFDHYVFEPNDSNLDHIPKTQLGILDSDSEMTARRIRSLLLNKLNR